MKRTVAQKKRHTKGSKHSTRAIYRTNQFEFCGSAGNEHEAKGKLQQDVAHDRSNQREACSESGEIPSI
jgi:hypothetical protein